MILPGILKCFLLVALSPSALLAESRADGEIEKVPGVNWTSLLLQSGLFVGVEHSFRLGTEEGARSALRGRFWPEYVQSVRGLKGWSDGDDFLTNYIGHPMQGSVAGYLFVQNDPRSRRLEFSKHGIYWRSRLKALAWSAVYSTQFELGPAGEAAIGNLGGPNAADAMGYVDLVVTPTGGFIWQVGEDAIDRYVVRWLETKTDVRIGKILVRGCLNPTRSFANILRFRVPWHRDTRPGVNELVHR